MKAERVLAVARATVSRVAARFRREGPAGLIDHRCYNGNRKVRPEHVARLELLLSSVPTDHGWQRPTWTCMLLGIQLARSDPLPVRLPLFPRAPRIRRTHPRDEGFDHDPAAAGLPKPSSWRTSAMSITVDAVYANGVLKLNDRLPLEENEKVQVTVQPTADSQAALGVVQRTYGIIGWNGDHETLERTDEKVANPIVHASPGSGLLQEVRDLGNRRREPMGDLVH